MNQQNKLKVFETFAGIGAQTKALKNINVEHEVVATSEWDINAIISYAYIHQKDEMQKFNNPTVEEAINYLKQYTFSSDGKKPLAKLTHLKQEKLFELYKAVIINKNFGSILQIKAKDLPSFDLLTYSYPCQAISLQGKQEGLKKGTGTSSSLLWEIERILLELKEENRLPKYLLMENVANLFSQKFMPYFKEWVSFLEDLGYQTKYDILKSSNFEIPQNRERAFAVSILKEKQMNSDFCHSVDEFVFTQKELTHKKIKDITDDIVDKSLFLNHLEEKLKEKDGSKLKVKNTGIKSTVLLNYTTFQSENIVYFDDGIAPTITANGAQSRIKIIDSKNNNHLRYLTGAEHLKLMGFTQNDYDNLKSCSYKIAEQMIKKQAGNSIVVNVLESIFNNLFKKSN